MKTSIKFVFRAILKIIAFLIHPFIVKSIAFIITSITTQYISKQFKKCGKNSTFLFPTTSHGMKYISIGENFKASSRFILEAYDSHLENRYTPEIIIGDNVLINFDCHISCINKIEIGNDVLIASKVFITDNFHGDTTSDSILNTPNTRAVVSKGPVVIEKNVWIGQGVAIMPNVRIGKNAIVGANSVVTKDVPSNCVVAGNPAKIIKELIENREG